MSYRPKSAIFDENAIHSEEDGTYNKVTDLHVVKTTKDIALTYE